MERISVKEEIKLVKRMEAEVLDETKTLEVIESELRKLETAIMKKKFFEKN